MPKNKRPAFLLYKRDWLGDPDLSRCSLAAQGAWLRLLLVMDDCSERGVLVRRDGTPLQGDEVAQMVGGPLHVARRAVDELVRQGVASVREDGAVVCRRLVREAEISALRTEAGSKGGSKTASKRGSKQGSKTAANENRLLDVCLPGSQPEPPKIADTSPESPKDLLGVCLPNSEAPPCPPPHPPLIPQCVDKEKMFEDFWEEYPKRVTKKGARVAFDAALKRAPFQKILAGVKRYRRECRGKEKSVIKNPDGWLKGDRWADEPAEGEGESDGRSVLSDPYGTPSGLGKPLDPEA